jgi:large conductance mechanosensitive channel
MIKEFRDFALRGNVLDLAVGFIIGAAFTAIVNSLVNDILMPLLGLITGGIDFSNQFVVLSPHAEGATYATLAAAQEAGAVTINYGLFINAIISFLLVALALFFVIRSMNRLMKAREQTPDATTPPEPTNEEQQLAVLEQIRDLMSEQTDRPSMPPPTTPIK